MSITKEGPTDSSAAHRRREIPARLVSLTNKPAGINRGGAASPDARGDVTRGIHDASARAGAGGRGQRHGRDDRTAVRFGSVDVRRAATTRAGQCGLSVSAASATTRALARGDRVWLAGSETHPVGTEPHETGPRQEKMVGSLLLVSQFIWVQ